MYSSKTKAKLQDKIPNQTRKELGKLSRLELKLMSIIFNRVIVDDLQKVVRIELIELRELLGLKKTNNYSQIIKNTIETLKFKNFIIRGEEIQTLENVKLTNKNQNNERTAYRLSYKFTLNPKIFVCDQVKKDNKIVDSNFTLLPSDKAIRHFKTKYGLILYYLYLAYRNIAPNLTLTDLNYQLGTDCATMGALKSKLEAAEQELIAYCGQKLNFKTYRKNGEIWITVGFEACAKENAKNLKELRKIKKETREIAQKSKFELIKMQVLALPKPILEVANNFYHLTNDSVINITKDYKTLSDKETKQLISLIWRRSKAKRTAA